MATLAILFCPGLVRGQHIDHPVPYFAFSKGLSITAPDSAFCLNFRFRMQNRVGLQTDAWTADALDEARYEAYVRRLRLRLDGFILEPRFNYIVQLSFSRSDMDWENTGILMSFGTRCFFTGRPNAFSLVWAKVNCRAIVRELFPRAICRCPTAPSLIRCFKSTGILD